MQIHGLNKTTLLDYPGHVAATVFTGGCNFRCPFCHNAGLVLEPGRQECIAEEEALAHLKKRKGILTGVCITGGEPTLQKDLADFLGRIKALGYLVKLDTNGYNPKVLQELLRENLLDYVAMDIKASRENYARAAGVPGLDLTRIQESIDLLQKSGLPYEFRTTVVKGIHSVEEFREIGRWLSGSRAYYLQSFRENENVLAVWSGQAREEENVTSGSVEAVAHMELTTFSKQEMEQMAALAGKYIDKVELRGVD